MAGKGSKQITAKLPPQSLEDRADGIAEKIGGWIETDPSDWRNAFAKLKGWALEALEKHEAARSRNRGLRALADDLGKRLAAVSHALTAVSEMSDEEIAAITQSHWRDKDERLPQVFQPMRDRIDGRKTAKDAEESLRALRLGLLQAIQKLRDDPARVNYPNRELRRDLALMARAWIPAGTPPAERWRALDQINALAGVKGPDPDENRTKFRAGYGDGWLDQWFK